MRNACLLGAVIPELCTGGPALVRASAAVLRTAALRRFAPGLLTGSLCVLVGGNIAHYSSAMSSRQGQRSVKAGSSAEDARAQRMRNTVELRKQKTDDKMKRLRNIDIPGGDTLGGGGDGGALVCNATRHA